ncbi:MAG: SoxR reducing system RseC family protein [Candidatus Cryptobacteroides sp.]
MAKKDDILHEGKILELTPEYTTVQIMVSSACSECHAKGLCGVADEKEKIIMLPSDPLTVYELGETVNVVTSRSMGTKAVWISYVIPLCILLILILSLSPVIGNELYCGLIGIGGVLLYYFFIWLFRKKLEKEFVFSIEKLQ